MRIGAPDLRVACDGGAGEVLFHDLHVAVTGPDNTRRMVGLSEGRGLEGMPLLHMRDQRDGVMPGWVEWCARYGHRERGADRGVVYPNARLAIPAVRQDIGFLVCGLSLCLPDLDAGDVVFAFPPAMNVPAPHPWRMILRGSHRDRRPQTERFLDWLRAEAAGTAARLAQVAGMEKPA